MNAPKSSLLNSRRNLALFAGAGALIVAAAVALPLRSTRTAARTLATQPVQTKLASIPVVGMFCLSCAATIKQKVKSLPGVVDAQVHFANKVVVINYVAGQSDVPARAAAAINHLGYKASEPTVLQ